jgi:archaellum biogenesis ATPase FlaH
MSSEIVSLKVISTGNEELDNRLGGGLPIPSLMVMEGDNGTGKTVLCVLFSIGFLNEGHKVVYITTENSVRGLLEQSKNISLDLTGDFAKGNIMIIPAHLEDIKWSQEQVKVLLDVLISFIREVSKRYDVIIMDTHGGFHLLRLCGVVDFGVCSQICHGDGSQGQSCCWRNTGGVSQTFQGVSHQLPGGRW